MQILLIEDNISYAKDVKDSLLSTCKNTSINLVSDFESAHNLLQSEFFDLVILDLSLPSTENGYDKKVEHGQKLFYLAQAALPGTPVYILTESQPDKFAMDLSRHGNQINLWGGSSTVPTVLYFAKFEVDKLIAEVKSACEEISILNSIPINTRGRDISFSLEQKRALRIFTRVSRGISCIFEPLSGLSGSMVGRLTVTDEKGHILTICVAKLGSASKVLVESAAYENHVKLMKIHAFAPLLKTIDKGLRSTGAIFYSLADGYDKTFFDVLSHAPNSAEDIVKKVCEALSRWSGSKELRRIKISEMRSHLITDDTLKQISERYELSFLEGIELIEINTYASCIHGDLHGGNILVNNALEPVLIDFGDVGPSYTCLDPITMEMSLLFHPDAISLGLSTDLHKVVEQWPQVEGYAQGSTLKAAITACRNWAYDVGGDDNAVLAAGYCFALRQLKYDSVDSAVTMNLLKGIAEKLLRNLH